MTAKGGALLKEVRRIFLYVVSGILFVFIFSLVACSTESSDGGTISMQDLGEATEGYEEGHLSAWLAYWNYEEGVKQLSVMADKISAVSIFGGYFNASDRIIIPEILPEKMKDITSITSGQNINLYLTVVNDYKDGSGQIIQKDSALITRLLQSGESRAKHIDDIIKNAKDGGYFGVEIDYEKIADSDWSNFVLFSSELYNRCVAENLDLKIIFEPSAPLEEYSFPDGPEYIIMAYNLYGYSSEAGPKANFDFINKLCAKMNNLLGKKWIAIAAGGYDFENGGETKQLTETEALSLINVYGVVPIRDNSSGALSFEYTDSEGELHTVWYADNITFDLWTKAAKSAGYSNIALWKLGDCIDSTVVQLKSNFVKE